MAVFLLPDDQTLLFHRVLISQMGDSPNLLPRAKRQLIRMRSAKPRMASTWNAWEGLLDLDLLSLAQHLLQDTSQAGLLRANSPLYDCLDEVERKSLWQRVALQRFVVYFHEAVDDLGFSEPEQAALTGLDSRTLAEWRRELPATMTKSALDVIKSVVSVHKSLAGFSGGREDRRGWLNEPNPGFGAAPKDVMLTGRLGEVEAYLVDAVKSRLTGADRPSI